MSDRLIQKVADAREHALAQRQLLLDQAEVTKERLQPVHLIADAKDFARDQVDQLKHDAIDHAKAHPVATTLGALGVVAWIARKPLLARAPNAVKRTYYWISGLLTPTPDIPDDDEDAYIDRHNDRRRNAR